MGFCEEAGCSAGTPDGFARCVEHLGDAEFETYGQRLGEGEAIDATDARISPALYERLLDHVPEAGSGKRIVRGDFSGARFAGDFHFESEAWQDFTATGARFDGAFTFLLGEASGGIDLSEATFKGPVEIEAGGDATWHFNESTFDDKVRLSLNGTSAHFQAAHCAGNVLLEDCKLDLLRGPSHAASDLALVRCDLGSASFSGHVGGRFALWRTVVRESVDLEYLMVGGRADLIEVVAVRVGMSECEVQGAFSCTAVGRWFVLNGCRFESAASLVLHADSLALDGSGFEQETVITGRAPATAWTGRRRPTDLDNRREKGLELAAKEALDGRWPSDSTKLTSVAGTRTHLIHIEDCDLAQCEFGAAIGLEELHLGRGCRFAPSPGRIARRDVLADEVVWRAAPRRRGERLKPWRNPDPAVPTWRAKRWLARLDDPHQHTPVPARGKPRREAALGVASAYRGLRAGLEDRKDQPGASDFYYGEMQMRRAAQRRDWPVLSLYWATSGYGTRPLRAAACLVLVIAVLGALFSAWGFDPGHGRAILDSVLFAARAAGNTLQQSDLKHLSDAGDTFRLLARVLLPVLLGFLAFALRSKVKR